MGNLISGLNKETRVSVCLTIALLRGLVGFCFILSLLFISSFKSDKPLRAKKNSLHKPISVIFETDMGNDIDDALALDMLYKYADQGKVNILAISTNKNSEYSIQYIDVLNTWYGYPDNYDTIISVGFSTNLARLLDTPADEFSPLSGKELVKKKVKLLSMMAGNFLPGENKEYNVMKDPDAARKVFAQRPAPIVLSPFKIGMVIHYPASSIQNDFTWTKYHPVAIGFETYRTMPYDSPAWDLTAVLYAIEGDEGYFDISPSGRISVDENTYTHFQEDKNGMHLYLKINPELTGKVRARFIELITTKPKSQK